jgi:thioredoxin reductase/Fe-S-cluster-containing hydrogenase component 2
MEQYKRTVELLVIGGGPAGLGASIEAARRGVETLLVDENEKPGGQLYKQIHKFFGSSEHYSGIRGFTIAEMLLKEAEQYGVRILTGTRAIGVLRDGRIVLSSADHSRAVSARRVVLATGGKEKSLPFPGWTLPGIMSAGAAQTMTNVHRVLPGEQILMVGSGNVGLIVAYQLMQAGAQMQGLVEIRDRIGGYYVHGGKLLRRGVPFYVGHRIVEARGGSRVREVDIEEIGTGTVKTISADTVCLSVGLSPRNELAGMLGCKLYSSALLGGHFPLHDRRMRSSKRAVYVAGDIAGIEEANSSLDEGRLAGISVAEDLGKMSKDDAKPAAGVVEKRLQELRSGSHGIPRLEEKAAVLQAAGAVSRGEVYSDKPFPGSDLNPGSGSGSGSGSDPGAGKIDDGARILQDALHCKHALPLIDCPETIPCNPCVDVCPTGAIRMDGICGLPRIEYDLCTGCMKCASACPGQAIFMISFGSVDDTGRITIPWEYLPSPAKGDMVSILDRTGTDIGTGQIISSIMPKRFDKTRLVTIEAKKELIGQIRSIRRLGEDV